MPKIYDNIHNQLLDGLRTTLDATHRSDFCVGYFNLRGWKQVAENIERFAGGEGKQCRLLIGMHRRPDEAVRELFSVHEQEPVDNATAAKLKKNLAREFRDQLTIGIPTAMDETGLRRLSVQIKNKKVVVKLFLRHPLHAKLYLLFRDDPISPVIGYVGSSNLTLAGLRNQGELNVDVIEQDAALKLAQWFNDRWEDRLCMDVSDELAQIIDESWASDTLRHPYHVYLKMAYHLSREARAGISEFKIPKEFRNELLDFQQKAVLVAAHHLNSDKRGGVIIGDVVGFGKTMTASAVAKIMEEDYFLETLIICPKNLVPMWEGYVHKYRLLARVISLAKVQSILPKARRYRIVLIDESHNFRNREGKRYRAIQEYIQLNESRVILLTATPYNKVFSDLSNQLRLFLPEDKDLGISPERYIQSIGGQVEFMSKFQTPVRSIAAFEKSEFADDWRELMRLFMVRRTRSFIRDNYAETDETNGRKFLRFADGRRFYFPDRTPKKVEFSFKTENEEDQYARLYSESIVETINKLNLSRYGLATYIEEHPYETPTKAEEHIIANLSRAGKRLMGFCRTNLFKRLESSGYSFLLSIARHILRNFLFVHALDKHLPFPIGQQEADLLDAFLDDEDPESDDVSEMTLTMDEQQYLEKAEKLYELYKTSHKHRYHWLRTVFFSKDLKQALIEDARSLIKVLALAGNWEADFDRKLLALHALLTKKHARDKVLIFTQFADTAQYLFRQLKRLGVDSIECVTGNTKDPTDCAYRFSPISNEKSDIKGTDREIRVLVTTDVLSEGQNLQDGHVIVNFDLPWALIRLIQRAGRVDRIGQASEKILCYSFLPEKGLEKIIRLRSRLKTRIQENAEVVGSDEVFFEGDPISLEDLYTEKAGILDKEDDSEVDLASYAYQIWKNATDADPELLQIVPALPNVVYATRAHGDKRSEGVIVYTRTADDNDILTWVDPKRHIITQSQLAILKAAECGTDEIPLQRLEKHHEMVNATLEHVKESESSIGGQLGKKSGAKYRTYMRLTRFYDENKDTLFADDRLKRAIDELYKYPLREAARDTLNRQLKAGIDDAGLADLVVSMREDNKLCIVDESDSERREPQIICSLGMKVGGR